MQYVFFGSAGLRASEIALGTMTFGTERGVGSDLHESRSIFSEFSDTGGNFLDSANTYTNGTSEKMIGEFLRGIRHSYVIATKYSLAPPGSDPNASGNHRKSLIRSIEGSLERLKTDYIDILWVHAWDTFTPIEETLRALDDLVRQGKILYIGISDTPAWIISHANILAELRGWTSFSGIQIEYSLIERTAERDLLPMARHYGLAILRF